MDSTTPFCNSLCIFLFHFFWGQRSFSRLKRIMKFFCLMVIFEGPFFLQSTYAQNWQWAENGGSYGRDEGEKVDVDAAGNIYVTGSFSGTAQFGSTTLVSAGNSDIYVAKLNPNGVFLWARRAGGENDEHGSDIVVDKNGGAVVVGSFGSENASFGSLSIDNYDRRGHHDIFIAKINSSGNWQWVEKVGDTVDDRNPRVALDRSGDIIFTGDFGGNYILFGADTINAGRDEIAVAKLNSSGTFQWIAKGSGIDSTYGAGTDVAVDAAGNIAFTGTFYGSSATFGSTTLTGEGLLGGNSEAFIAKLNSSGGWQWARKIGGVGYDYGKRVEIDGNGNVVVAGEFAQSASFGPVRLINDGFSNEIFVARLSPKGAWQWAEKVGGRSSDSCKDIDIDVDNNVLITGLCIGPVKFGSSSLTAYGSFVARLNPTGVWQQAIGSDGFYTNGVAADADGNAVVTGTFGGGRGSFGTITLDSNGGSDSFVASLNWSPVPVKLNVYHREEPGNPLPRREMNYEMAGAIKVAADFTEGTVFKVTHSEVEKLELHIRENATNTSDDNVAHVTGYISSMTTNGDSIVAVYHHPAFVDSLTLRQGLNLDVVDVSNSDAGLILASYKIAVVQPPLMLVHGLWSNGESAFPGLKSRLVDSQLFQSEEQIRYADYFNDRAFADNAQAFISHKNALLKAYSDDNVSASKIDIIAHSMGGLLSRQYIQDDGAYQNDVNKLITLNTPHSGSQIANFAVLLPPPVTTALALANHDPTAGAVEDLRYNSPAIVRLNTNPDTKGVAIHALTTNIDLNPLLPLNDLLNGKFGFEGFLAGWAALTYPDAAEDINSFLTDDVFDNPHDLFVGLNSQQGGLDESTRFVTHFFGQSHSSGGIPAVQEKMSVLLRENSYSNSVLNPFTRNGFQPITIKSDFPNLLIPLPDSISTSVIEILAPTLNTVVVDADSIQVTVDASDDVTRILLLSGTSSSTDLATKLIEGSEGTVYVKIPEGSIGQMHLTAFAFSGSEYVQYDTLSIGLTSNAALTAIHLEPRPLFVSRYDSAIVNLIGNYSDGVDRNLSGNTDVSYSFSNGYAEIRGGYLVGLSIGIDTLLVSYGGQTDKTEVTVTEPADLAIDLITSIIPSTNSSEWESNILVFPNPATDIVTVTIPYDGIHTPFQITLVNSIGEKVYNQLGNMPISGNRFTLNTRSLAKGVYILILQCGSKTVVKKIIVN
jgi:pimeloyl-ACP methyl ester carboxylesterase